MNQLRWKVLFLSAFIIFTTMSFAGKPIKLLVVVGGHSFDTTEFFQVYDNMKDITWEKAVQPKANKMIENGEVDEYDVILFYDMYDDISEKQKQAYMELLEKGKAMIFTHHAIVSYQDWPEFKKIVGGKYHREDDGSGFVSDYEHDVDVEVKIVDKKHPIVKGINDFTIHDEIYGNCEILPTVKPLLEVNNPKSMKYVAWVNPYKKSEVIYIQLGHDKQAYKNPDYRRLIEQAIGWAGMEHKK